MPPYCSSDMTKRLNIDDKRAAAIVYGNRSSCKHLFREKWSNYESCCHTTQNNDFMRTQCNWLYNMGGQFGPITTVMVVYIAIQAKMGLLIKKTPLTSINKMFMSNIRPLPSVQGIQSEKFSCRKNVTLKFLNMFDFVWQTYSTLWTILYTVFHGTSIRRTTALVLLLLPLLMQQPLRFSQKQDSCPFQVQQITNLWLQTLLSFSSKPAMSLALGVFLLLNYTFAKHAAHCYFIHSNI